MAAEPVVAVQHERDIAVVATHCRPAGTTVERGRDAAAVEEQDRLATVLLDRAELGKEGRRQGVAGLTAQVDDANRRQRACEAAAEVESFERPPALGARRRAAEHRYGAFESGAFHGD